MAETSIQWADYTFNPWIGCQRVSPGCEHCYAETQDSRKRWGGETHWGPTRPRYRTAESTWKQPLKWNREAQVSGQRRKVFCASLADVFEDRLELAPWRMELLDLIRRTPSLDWLLLTKRPENIRKAIASATCTVRGNNDRFDSTLVWLSEWLSGHRVPSNILLGTTVEDQQRANERIPHLLAVPAVVRFLSCEPLLERIDLSAFMSGPYVGLPGDVVHENFNAGIDWVIIGGESGPGARPFDAAWARSLRDQCKGAGVAFFMKQFGPRALIGNQTWLKSRDRAGGDPAEWPADLRVREFPEVAP